MPATNDLQAYRAKKREGTAKGKFRDVSSGSYSLTDNENTKPSWLEVSMFNLDSIANIYI